MSFLKKTSFASGELDPALHDNTDIKAYYSGLKTARNVTIGKTGRILNTAGTWHYANAQQNDDGIRIYVPEIANTSLITTPHFFEFGVGYVKVNLLTEIKDQNYKRPLALPIIQQVANSYVASDLPKLRFATIKRQDGTYWTYVACAGKKLEAFTFTGTSIVRDSDGGFISGVPVDYPILEDLVPLVTKAQLGCLNHDANYINNTMLGHRVVYGFTLVTKDGQESPILEFSAYSTTTTTVTAFRLPTAADTLNFQFQNIKIPICIFECI
jgi:hypothetical protein